MPETCGNRPVSPSCSCKYTAIFFSLQEKLGKSWEWRIEKLKMKNGKWKMWGTVPRYETGAAYHCGVVCGKYLDEHILQVRPFELSKYISRRRMDFTYGFITDCYVVFNGQAVRVNARYQTRLEIENKISMLRPWTSQSTASYRRRLRSLMLSRLYATLIFFCCKVTHFSPFHQIFLPFSCVLSEKVAIFCAR